MQAGFLARVAESLLAQPRGALAQTVVLVPGRRAGRRLLELLALQANAAFEPPRIVTEAGLAQALSKTALSLASVPQVECAWHEVLGKCSAAELALFAPTGDGLRPGALRWSLARQLAALDREAAAEQGAETAQQSARERALFALSTRVVELLARSGWVDPGRALQELSSATNQRRDVQLVLAGVGEISPALHKLLKQLSPTPIALIQAVEDCAAGFDEFGALQPDYWEKRRIPLRDENWRAVDDPRAAVSLGLDWLAQLPAGTALDQVAIGVLGDELLAGLEHALGKQGLMLHAAVGDSLRSSSPWLALKALHAWLTRGDFQALASVLRHPELERCLHSLAAQAVPRVEVGQLDAWHAEHLPDLLEGQLPGQGEAANCARALRDGVRTLCTELAAQSPRPLSRWSEVIGKLLCSIFPTLPESNAQDATRTRSALEHFAELAQQLAGLAQQGLDSVLSAEQALQLWLDWSADTQVRSAGEEAAIEALGWLELAQDDADYLLILGLNEGWVPQSERASVLEDQAPTDGTRPRRSRTRLARDAHALTVIAQQRQGNERACGLLALSLRRGVGDDPLRPSRLLFHTDDAAALDRARAFFQAGAESPQHATAQAADESTALQSLPLRELPKLKKVSVSTLKSFLASPYLCYLERVLKLRRVRDDAWELDPILFGSLVHDVLELWGDSPCRDSGDRVEIEEFVLGALDRLSAERHGTRPLPAVRLQLQQLERRLSTFARIQAQEFQSGWRVEFVEHTLADARLDVDGVSIQVSGRIDRIDRHEADGRRRILDYKTGTDAEDPLRAHLRGGRWLDLQLPLYRHFLAAQLGGELETGYFAIPSKLELCGVHIAHFKPEHAEQALGEARRVLREMLADDYARVGSAKPSDRVQRALCGLSLLSLDDGDPEVDDDENEAGS